MTSITAFLLHRRTRATTKAWLEPSTKEVAGPESAVGVRDCGGSVARRPPSKFASNAVLGFLSYLSQNRDRAPGISIGETAVPDSLVKFLAQRQAQCAADKIGAAF